MMWTDPVTGVTVEATANWLYLIRGNRTKAVSRHAGAWTGTPENAGIIQRWKESHEEDHD